MLFDLLFDLGWKLIVIAFFIGLLCIAGTMLVIAFEWVFTQSTLLGWAVIGVVITGGVYILHGMFKD
jgi:hypothetical protein